MTLWWNRCLKHRGSTLEMHFCKQNHHLWDKIPIEGGLYCAPEIFLGLTSETMRNSLKKFIRICLYQMLKSFDKTSFYCLIKHPGRMRNVTDPYSKNWILSRTLKSEWGIMFPTGSLVSVEMRWVAYWWTLFWPLLCSQWFTVQMRHNMPICCASCMYLQLEINISFKIK